jgi:hypothetical protein
MRIIVGRETDRPTRSVIIRCSLLGSIGRIRIRDRASGLSSFSQDAAPSGVVRSVNNSRTRPRSRRAAKARRSRLAASSHWTSSMATSTGEASASLLTIAVNAATTAR